MQTNAGLSFHLADQLFLGELALARLIMDQVVVEEG